LHSIRCTFFPVVLIALIFGISFMKMKICSGMGPKSFCDLNVLLMASFAIFWI
jgi:hypothetical protein